MYSPSLTPVRFTPVVVDEETGLAELRTYPAPSEEPSGPSSLALIGSNGLLDFADLQDPAKVNVPDGMTIDWTSFRLGEGGQGAPRTLEYVGGDGAWVAFPNGNGGDWSVKWKNSEFFFSFFASSLPSTTGPFFLAWTVDLTGLLTLGVKTTRGPLPTTCRSRSSMSWSRRRDLGG